MMPINLSAKGESHKILRIAGSETLRHRLEALGFVAGEDVTLISEINGNYIISLKGTRIGLGRELARLIIVL